MTYTFTHLTLEGLAIWELLPKKLKEYYKEHRWEFIFINIFAVLPDLDVLFGYHRSYTHSIVIPTFFLLSILVAEQFSKLTQTFSEQTKRFTRFTKLAILMWIVHIFLDFGWGPLMLFWPLNNHFYDFTVYFRFENNPWLFVPLTLIGIIPNWTILTYNEGINTFFINLSQTEREKIYGHYIDFYIETVMLHILLIIVWLTVIFIPIFRRKGVREEAKRSRKIWIAIKKVLLRQLTILGAFIILLGLTLGPIIGTEYQNKYTINVELKATNSSFDPTLGTEISLPENAKTELIYSSEVGLVNYTTSIILTDEEHFWSFFNNFDNLSNTFLNGTIGYSTLINEYKILVTNATTEAYYQVNLTSREAKNVIVITLNNTARLSKVYFMALICEWNYTKSFIYSANLEIIYTYNRSREQIEGAVLSIVGSVIILIDQLTGIIRTYKPTKGSKLKD